MNLNLELIINILGASAVVSCFTTALIQKTKNMIPDSKFISLYSFLINMVLGTLFMLCFSDYDVINSIWTGLMSFIGADTIYKMLEDKGIIKKYTDMQKDKVIIVSEDNYIKRGDE